MKKNKLQNNIRNCRKNLLKRFIIPIMAFLLSILPLTKIVAQCGPGPHWIDNCMAGVDVMENTYADVGINLDTTDCDLPADMEVSLIGPTTVNRSNPKDILVVIGNDTLARVDGHFDVIETEIISMDLVSENDSIKMIAGSGLGQGGLLLPSIGYIIEDPSDDTKGLSIFFVYVEIEIITATGTFYLYNHDSLLIASEIIEVPPLYSDYVHGVFSPTLLCLKLYTHPFAGTWVANLIDATHTPVPTLPQWGLLIFAMLLLSFGSVFIYNRQLAIAGTVCSDQKVISHFHIPFVRKTYFKVLSVVLLVVVGGLVIINLFSSISAIDIGGTIISSFIFAYIIHLGLLSRKR